MKIGILQAGHLPDAMIERTGDYDTLFSNLLGRHGFELQFWPVVDGVFPDSAEEADGWLITGSRHGAYDDLPWIPRLEDFIRAIVAADKPLVGVCFGHQVIAQALGGKVEKFGGGWSVGPTEYDFNGAPLRMNAWHQDQVVEKPEGAEVVGESDFCRYAALLYPGKIYTVQAHPEFTDEVAGLLIETRGRGVVPDDRLTNALAALGTPLDSAGISDQFARFFRERRIA
ncbi:type 1 glutamine amidotransferase [Thetidibacter halocola]|uniref:Type 1 glutamine amidotransferase n=1 Tax=Thetidibacter halocola TaxID=2827239 RepID=A0A8J7WDA8_9RHOB|nr:type 1 glutamine amidotransferase [Thetidibacter halocola]MBS0123236.1 type 1 glutamine amidotransferase [Thetidibacter halocola]